MTDEGIAQAIEEEVGPEWEEAAQNAQENCPVSAIEQE